MKNVFLVALCLLVVEAKAQQVQQWLTKADKSVLFQPLSEKPVFGAISTVLPSIYVDDTKRFQQMDGFGFTLTGGSAMLLQQMKAEERANLLKQHCRRITTISE